MFERVKTYKPNLFARLFMKTPWRLIIDYSNPESICLNLGFDIRIACLDMTSVLTSKGRFWHRVEVLSGTRIDRLAGLTAGTAQKLVDDMLDLVNSHLGTVIETDHANLSAVDQKLESVISEARQYLALGDLAAVISSIIGPATRALSHPLFDSARIPKKLAASLPKNLAMWTDPAERRRYNDNFVVKEMAKYEQYFDKLIGVSLSRQQREACIRLEDSNLLVASAGSGKTATMVAKVAYVLMKGLYAEEEILLLALNKDVASELRERVALQLGVAVDDMKCRVTTFHALGRDIIREVNGRPPQLVGWIENASAEAKFLADLINSELERSDEFRRIWVEMLLLFPEATATQEVIEPADDEQEYREDRASGANATLMTMSGAVVRSLQERRIADWLWLNSIDFEYEKQFEFTDEHGAVHYFAPDFYYPATDTYHEHFAIGRDGTSPFPGYVEIANRKRLAMSQVGADFFETSSAMDVRDDLLTELAAQLSQRGIHPRMRGYCEIVKALEPTVVQLFQNLVAICIRHIRSSGLTSDILLERAQTLSDPNRAKRFAKVVWHITESYNQDLGKSGRIDFDSMIADAVAYIKNGSYRSPYSLILVDEFQDISESRLRLINALRYERPHSKVFAVGDDWQSIYRFSGSDVSIFTDFEKHLGVNWVGKLEQTYRSNQFIADAAAGFVQQNPLQLKKVIQSTRPAVPQSIRVVPIRIRYGKTDVPDACTGILSRLNEFARMKSPEWQSEKKPKLKVLVLARYKKVIPLQIKQWNYSHLDIAGFTFHRSKGLEADYTILLDVSEGRYGIPSLIQDDELLHLVVPRPEKFPYAEERRLFYVALTRASRGVFMISNENDPSRYIGELQDASNGGLRYETPDGMLLRKCKKCRTGFLGEQIAEDGSPFLRCNRFSSCEETTYTDAVASN